MEKIEPSQFLEVLLNQQRRFNSELMELKVRDFNKMIDELSEMNISASFGYSDFIQYINRFYKSIPYQAYSLHIAYNEDLLNEIKRINTIYERIDNQIDCVNLWKKYIK